MKKLIALTVALSAVSSHSAFSATRVYSGQITTASQESKFVTVKVDDEVKEHRYGDPEIKDHGFIRKYVEVRVSEGYQGCSVALYLDDGDLRLCSGGRLNFQPAQSLLSDQKVKAALFMNGFSKALGQAELSFDGIEQPKGSEDVD